MVYVDIPGGLNLSLSLPLVIGTIPLHAFTSRTSSISSYCCTVSWPERPEAPPSYSDLAVTEEQRQGCLERCEGSEVNQEGQGTLQAYITEFRFQPPPLYSEVDPNPEPSCGGQETRPLTLSLRTTLTCSEQTGNYTYR